jgi:hypothetical protein
MIAVTYPNKKALKAAIGQPLHYIETSMFKAELVPNKAVPFVGPSARERRFYGSVTVDSDFRIIKVV